MLFVWACAALTALVSLVSSSNFIFEGFLPKKKVDRDNILIEISKRRKTIIYETHIDLKNYLEN